MACDVELLACYYWLGHGFSFNFDCVTAKCCWLVDLARGWQRVQRWPNSLTQLKRRFRGTVEELQNSCSNVNAQRKGRLAPLLLNALV